MDLHALQLFVAVVRRGSFASVARDVDLAPSSVSRAIAGLEDDLGVRLFQRTTRRLAPTEAGLLYYDRVEPLVHELEEARQAAVDTGTHLTGTLRIAAPVSFAHLNVLPLLPRFAQAHPDLTFDVVLTDGAPDLVDERIDIALRLGPLAPSGVIAQRLAPMVGHVCASPDYLNAHGCPDTLDDLTSHRALHLDMPGFSDTWRLTAPDGTLSEVTLPGRLRSSNAIALKNCALAGMGILLQAHWIVGRELESGTLVDLFPDHQATAATFDDPAIWLLYPSRQYVPRKVQTFVQYLRQMFAAGPPWAC